MIDGYPQKIIEMIGIKIHQLSIQTSVIGRHLGLPLQGDLDGYSKVCDIRGGGGGGMGGGGGDNWHIIHHKFSIHILQANVISHRLGYVTIFFGGGGGVLDNWY